MLLINIEDFFFFHALYTFPSKIFIPWFFGAIIQSIKKKGNFEKIHVFFFKIYLTFEKLTSVLRLVYYMYEIESGKDIPK